MSMTNLVAPLWEKITAASAIGARPTLVTHGADITPWRKSLFTPPDAVVLIDGSVAADLTSPAGGTEGVELWGYIRSLWKFLGVLKAGGTIHIVSATQGHAEQVTDVGLADRLAIAATVSAGASTATFAPLESWGGR